MTRASVVRTCVTAAATALVTLAIFWSPTGMAEGEEAKKEIQWPTLTVSDCTLTLRLTKTKFDPDDAPVVEIHAVNPAKEAVEQKVVCEILSMATPNTFARMIPMPKSVWKTEQTLTLDPGETTISIPADAKMANGTTFYARLSVGDKQTQTTSFAVGKPVVLGATPQIKQGLNLSVPQQAPAPAER